MSLKIWKQFTTKPQSVWLLLLFLLTFSLSASTSNSNERVPPFKVTAIKAMLFYEDKGTFSPDVSEAYSGPPYSLFKLWNTPMQYENRSSSVLVIVEVTGDGEVTPERKLEFTARYVPLQRESREIVVRRVVPIHIAIKVRERDKYHAGFWLYDTGCNPVKLSARIIGSREAPTTNRLIKFGCGE